MASWWENFFTPAQGAQNSAQMRTAARPSDVPAYVATPDTSTPNAPDTMTDADRAYYQMAANSPGLSDLKQNFSTLWSTTPDPGAKNSAYKNLPQGYVVPTATVQGQDPADLIAGYSGGVASQQNNPPPADSKGNPSPLLQALQGGQAASSDQSGAAAAADNSPAGAGGGGIANLPTSLPVASGTPDVTADQTDPVAAGAAAGPGLLANLMGQAQQSAGDPNASKGFLGKLADSFSDLGDKLTNLSPAASQGFLMAGLNMLANNSGGKNLSQLVGGAGQAGIEQYQAVKQQQIANQMAMQKQAFENWKDTQDIAIRANQPTMVNPGQAITSPARQAAGLGPAGPAIPKIAWRSQKNSDGTTTMVPYNEMDPSGQALGPGYKSDNSWSADQNKNVQDASNEQTNANTMLNRTNMYLGMLSPYQLDPKTGQPMLDAQGNKINNPNYVSPAGGVFGKLAGAFTNLTGSQSNDQTVAQQIVRDLRGSYLGAFKNTGANRITGFEYQTLVNGLPEHPDAATLQNYLQLVAKAQNVAATNAQIKSEFLAQNHGNYHQLDNDSTIMGHTYKAGTQLNAIQDGTAKDINGGIIGTPDPEPPQQQQGAAPAAPAAPVAAPTANRQLGPVTKADVQAELKRRGLSG